MMIRNKKTYALALSSAVILGGTMMIPAQGIHAEELGSNLVENQTNTTATVSTAEEFTAAVANANVKEILVENPIEIHDSLTINDKTIMSSTSGSNANFLTFFKGATFNNVTVNSGANDKSAIHMYKCSGTFNNVTINHNGVGAPIIGNGAESKLTFTGNVILKLNEESWYGINLDNGSTADFTGATLSVDTPSATQSAVCVEREAAVNGLDISVVKTADGQTAYVQSSDLAQFVEAKQEKDVTEVIINEDVEINDSFVINEEMTITANNGAKIYTNKFAKPDNAVTVMNGISVEFNNVAIQTDSSAKSGLHVYGGKVIANNLTVDNTVTDGGAAVIVNSGSIDLNGTTTFNLGENSWGGINLDNRITGGNNPSVNIGENAVINVKADGQNEVNLYYTDKDSNVTPDIKVPETVKVTMNGTEVTLGTDGEITTSIPWTDLEPSEPAVPLTPLEPSQPIEKPQTPEEPTTPTDPVKPITPITPETPAADDETKTPVSSEKSADEEDKTPDTGTYSNVLLLGFTFIVSAIGMVGTILFKRRHQN